MLKITHQETEHDTSEPMMTLDELAREGAQRMLAHALEAEVEAYIERHLQCRWALGPSAGGPGRGRYA